MYERPPMEATPSGWRSFNEIAQIMAKLQSDRSPVLRQMRDILDRYDGDWVIPVPSVANEPTLPPLTPALIGEAIDTKARRASSVTPTLVLPAIDPNKDTGRRSREYASIRKAYIQAVYEQSRWSLGRRRFYRQLSAYETASLVVVPDFGMRMPMIESRDPLGTFAEPQAYEQLRDPEYVGFVTRHSGAYLRSKFPWVRAEYRFNGPITDQEQHEMWDVVEWYDHDQVVHGIIGPVRLDGEHVAETTRQAPWIQLSPQWPNKFGMLPAVVPHNVSLGRVASRIGTLLGNVDVQAKLMALDIIAQEKAIFPDMYAIGQQNQIPLVVGGAWKDGREGDINMLQGVTEVGMMRSTPDQRTQQIIDRLERNVRVSTGLSGITTGENTSNLRTGRAIDTLAGASIDPIVQEMHEISEAYLSRLNSAILACGRNYFADNTLRVFLPNGRGSVEVKPREHIEVFDGPEKHPNRVRYAIAGTDAVEATQVLGSLYGAGAISRQTMRTKHPLIEDGEAEGRLVDEEQFEQAVKDSLIHQVQQGTMSPMVLVEVRDEMQKGVDVFEALRRVNERAQQTQAQQPPPAPPGMAAAPEAMPGLMAGPAALQAPAAPPPEVNPQVLSNVSQMRQLQQAMR